MKTNQGFEIPKNPYDNTKMRAPPKPPKYLVKVSDDSSKEEIVKVLFNESNSIVNKDDIKKSKNTQGYPVKMTPPSPNSFPLINKRVSNFSAEPKSFGLPHRFPSRVDSAVGSKSSSLSRGSLRRHELNSRERLDVNKITSNHRRQSNTTVMTNNVNGSLETNKIALPFNVAVPKFVPPIDPNDFMGESMLSRRTASGSILGSHDKRYVDTVHVPVLEGYEGYQYHQLEEVQNESIYPDMGSSQNVDELYSMSSTKTAGPYNQVVPYVVLDSGQWSQCWDEEVKAVYYYNHDTGEASWLPPDAS